jgi:DNA/RNA endonuclease YhcR with UshA esterase domain
MDKSRAELIPAGGRLCSVAFTLASNRDGGNRMTSWRRCLVVVFVLLGSVGMSGPARAVDTARRVLPIAVARTLPLGTVVTVDGTATTPSGAFESSFFDKGFGLQDRSAGIYVSVTADPHIAVRTQVRVTGVLRDSFGLLILVPDDPAMIRAHGTGPEIRPTPRATGAVNESSEGRLVRVVAAITQAPASDPPFGSKFFVNDGSGELTIFVNTQTNIDLNGLAVGKIVSVTGFSSQFDTHYEIDPRFPGDIIVHRH